MNQSARFVSSRPSAFALSISLTLAAALSIGQNVLAQTDSSWTPPQTERGVPDVQGIWDYSSRTALERHPRFEGKLVITQEEAERLVPTLTEYTDALEAVGAEAPGPHNVGGYNAFWISPGDWLAVIDGGLRSSFIVQPEDGRIPWTEQGREIRAQQRSVAGIPERGENDGPEGRSLAERCLVSFASTVPLLPSLYNNTIQIVQGSDHVMILSEMAHDARIVKLDGDFRKDGMRKWLGDSIGYYEDNELVVETINFHPLQVTRGGGYTSESAKVTERFSRKADGSLLYRFTVEDPQLYLQPWTGELPMQPASALYEYACHEGNHSMPGILAGARVVEELESAQ